MRSFPSGPRTARRRPRHRPPRGLVSAVVAACAAVATAGCTAQAGVRDDGTAPTLSAPASAVPLWPGYTPPATSAPAQESDLARYLPVDEVQVPAGGLAALSAKNLLLHDPNVPSLVQKEISACPADGTCPLRDAVHRDLTGDDRDEMVVAVDLPRFERTLLQVYTASGHTVRPVLIYWGPQGLTGETRGRDLVISAIGEDGRVTTRFRWNGRVMAAVTPAGGTGTRPDFPGAVPAVPDAVSTVPQSVPTVPDAVPDDRGAVDTAPRTETRTTR
ncbi:hypothetical protein PS467_04355 [Streptomyces luomodiensis]|uniref:Lipoprotein n=1 Tax=Streptomyces luomodiensis TaxID=3026192 RepID=A0ABY9UPY6_9ACTN|nr:hypothetical protein [Streptomyces sp. SCA4-21]WNE94622.1 hypothetical protein PS467_04355 [Streptomyces sp. SCA4-21]